MSTHEAVKCTGAGFRLLFPDGVIVKDLEACFAVRVCGCCCDVMTRRSHACVRLLLVVDTCLMLVLYRYRAWRRDLVTIHYVFYVVSDRLNKCDVGTSKDMKRKTGQKCLAYST